MIPPHLVADLARRGLRRRYQPGTVLFSEGGPGDWVGVLATGRVKVSTCSEDGKETVLGFRGEGELIGELSAIDGEPRSATVSAHGHVEVAAVSADQFSAFLRSHPDFALALLRSTTQRLRDADRKRIEFGVYDTTARVARRLIELMDEHGEATGEGVVIDLPLSQDELAGWTGSSREAVARALQTLRRRGLVSTGRRRIMVRDPEALRRQAFVGG